jgi:hypothetical protein
MKHFQLFLFFALPATSFAQKYMLDHFDDDPFLTGGTKSIVIRPLQSDASLRPPRTVLIPIDTDKYPYGITSFKIIAGTKTYLINKREFKIVIWPNMLTISQDLANRRVVIDSLQGFANVGPRKVVDYINARPMRVEMQVGSGIFARKVSIDCPADCSFVLGAHDPTKSTRKP